MGTLRNTQPAHKLSNIRTLTGVILLVAGGILFLDRYLRTGWLSLLILPAVGLFLYLLGVRMRQLGMILTGGLIGGFGAGGIAAWGPSIQLLSPGSVSVTVITHPVTSQIGFLALFTGASWIIILLTVLAMRMPPTWWAMIPGGVLGGLGFTMLFTPMHWTDFIFCIGLGVGFPLLLWGLATHLIGLIIPGSLLMGIAPGIYLAWSFPAQGNGLTQTGIMLSWFAFGWALITACGRMITHKYIWWPLIPGGILIMVGMGLYIGGDPRNALGFIGNTGSIALMIFGLYLLLMRKSIHH